MSDKVPDNIPTNVRRDINVLKSDVWLALENAEDWRFSTHHCWSVVKIIADSDLDTVWLAL